MMMLKEFMSDNTLLPILPLFLPLWIVSEIVESGYYVVTKDCIITKNVKKPSFENSFYWLWSSWGMRK